MRVLVLNAGASSLKASVLETIGLQTLARTEVSLGTDATRSEARRRSVNDVLQSLRQSIDLESVGAVGHRVVHGGTRFRTPVRIDAEVLAGVEALTEFAPLHNRVAADTIRAAQSAFPSLPQVAAFDTAFHASLPPAGFVYPVPYRWYKEWGIRRFGFHGLSVTWALERAGVLLRKPSPELGLVVAHLGSGCSVTAVWRGRSVDTSMRLTPRAGRRMGGRAGGAGGAGGRRPARGRAWPRQRRWRASGARPAPVRRCCPSRRARTRASPVRRRRHCSLRRTGGETAMAQNTRGTQTAVAGWQRGAPGASQFGVVGLATMGMNLARNIASKGIPVSVYNRTTARTDEVIANHGNEGPISGAHTVEELVSQIARPRSILIMVKAGPPVDETIAHLVRHLDKGDILIDGGNSYFMDTMRRGRELEAKGMRFIGA